MKKLFNYTAHVERVVDADTFDCLVDMGMRVYHRARVRVMGVDAPERGQVGYEVAKEYALDRLNHAYVCLSSNGKDSFGRWLCWVWVCKPEVCSWDLTWHYGDELIDAGYGEPYVKG
jgi:micrococcal nuclease